MAWRWNSLSRCPMESGRSWWPSRRTWMSSLARQLLKQLSLLAFLWGAERHETVKQHVCRRICLFGLWLVFFDAEIATREEVELRFGRRKVRWRMPGCWMLTEVTVYEGMFLVKGGGLGWGYGTGSSMVGFVDLLVMIYGMTGSNLHFLAQKVKALDL